MKAVLASEPPPARQAVPAVLAPRRRTVATALFGTPGSLGDGYLLNRTVLPSVSCMVRLPTALIVVAAAIVTVLIFLSFWVVLAALTS